MDFDSSWMFDYYGKSVLKEGHILTFTSKIVLGFGSRTTFFCLNVLSRKIINLISIFLIRVPLVNKELQALLDQVVLGYVPFNLQIIACVFFF